MGIDAAVIAIVATVVSTVASTAGAIYASNQAAKAEEYNAKVAEVQGTQAQMAAAQEAEDRRRRARYLLGTRLAEAGAGGLALEGSPLLTMVDEGVQEDLEARRSLYKGYLEASGMRSASALARYQADSTRTAGYVGAGQSLLRGSSSVAGQQAYGNNWRG